MLRKALAAVVLVSALTAPAFGQVKIDWQFKEGDKFYVEEVSKVKVTIKVPGKDVNDTENNTTVASYTIKKATPNEVVIEQKIESVTSDVKGQPQAGIGGMGKIMEKMQGAKFTITMDPATRKVTKFEGYKALIKSIAEDDEMTAKMVQELLSEDALKKGSEDAFGFVPTKPVSKGDTWQSESVVPMGPFGSFKRKATYTYDGKEQNGEKISYKLEMIYSPPKGEGAFGGLMKVTKGNLKTDGAKGVIIFDAEKGRLVSNTLQMRHAGALTFDVMGMEIVLDLAMDQNSVSRVLDKAPKAKEK